LVIRKNKPSKVGHKNVEYTDHIVVYESHIYLGGEWQLRKYDHLEKHDYGKTANQHYVQAGYDSIYLKFVSHVIS